VKYNFFNGKRELHEKMMDALVKFDLKRFLSRESNRKLLKSLGES